MKPTTIKHYTVNTQGNNVAAAKSAGYRAYYANGITAIEITAVSKNVAKHIGEEFGKVLFIFE
jgi:hypothetical protein